MSGAPGRTRELRVVDLGRRGYGEVLELQRRLAHERKTTRPDHDLLLLVEHDPVITLGRGAADAHVLADAAWLETRGIDVVEVERGGDVTYHGPGQLVGYPILDLHAHRADLHWYLRRLEEALLRVVAGCGLPGYRVETYTGVWTGQVPGGWARSGEDDGFDTLSDPQADQLIREGKVRKLGSIGVHASRWITWHGFALNVTPEPLSNFPGIVPCGIDGVAMTSLASEGAVMKLSEVIDKVLRGFHAAFPTLRARRIPETDLSP